MSCFPNRVLAAGVTMALREESTWGTYSAAGHISRGLEFRSETMGNSRRPTDGESFVGDGRNELPGRLGVDDPGGSVEGEALPNGGWPLLLKHALHGGLVTTGAGPWTHTFAPSDAVFTGFSLDKRFRYRDGTEQYLRYLGCRVRRMNLRVATGILTARAELVAAQEVEVEAPFPTFAYPETNEPFSHLNAILSLDLDGDGSYESFGTAYDLDLSIDNNLGMEAYVVETGDAARYRDRLPVGLRTVTGGFRCMFTPDTYQLYQLYGANSPSALKVRLERGSLVWQLEMPAVALRGSPTPKVGRGPVMLDFAFRAHRDPVSGDQLRGLVVNQDDALNTLV